MDGVPGIGGAGRNHGTPVSIDRRDIFLIPGEDARLRARIPGTVQFFSGGTSHQPDRQ
jgi:hypothetical protein